MTEFVQPEGEWKRSTQLASLETHWIRRMRPGFMRNTQSRVAHQPCRKLYPRHGKRRRGMRRVVLSFVLFCAAAAAQTLDPTPPRKTDLQMSGLKGAVHTVHSEMVLYNRPPDPAIPDNRMTENDDVYSPDGWLTESSMRGHGKMVLHRVARRDGARLLQNDVTFFEQAGRSRREVTLYDAEEREIEISEYVPDAATLRSRRVMRYDANGTVHEVLYDAAGREFPEVVHATRRSGDAAS